MGVRSERRRDRGSSKDLGRDLRSERHDSGGWEERVGRTGKTLCAGEKHTWKGVGQKQAERVSSSRKGNDTYFLSNRDYLKIAHHAHTVNIYMDIVCNPSSNANVDGGLLDNK